MRGSVGRPKIQPVVGTRAFSYTNSGTPTITIAIPKRFKREITSILNTWSDPLWQRAYGVSRNEEICQAIIRTGMEQAGIRNTIDAMSTVDPRMLNTYIRYFTRELNALRHKRDRLEGQA